MSRTLYDQTLALAGVFQAARLVQQTAHGIPVDPRALETSIRSLFVTVPDTTLDVYGGDLANLHTGLETLASVMSEQSRQQDIDILRYALNLAHLESKLRSRSDLLDVIGNRIEQARHTASHFGHSHPNLLANLASIYTDTISTFRLRIQVTGNPDILQRDENAEKIRALLLAGIRSAVLWRQCGGRRWQLVLARRKVIHTARELARRARHGHPGHPHD
ncbi:high frequency lysogenization protein HflD [Marinobacter lutaoensis]|jgi:high frequency lysogenization protein|uniref:high frequency lysogenization protein HflD n=1 Tax=Marinobacter lutaoensis TaxID=135739 RepID=UPI0015949216|nr:high frequency lysogenization protein HflD [Marinobacter lutaoensis]NVD35389.1 high frequency lysogenization protein HflD [Marinobacter lutaoensis]